MKKILLIIVTLFISDIAYSQVQRGNNFQRRGTVDRDQISERLEMRRESVQSGEIDPVCWLCQQKTISHHAKKNKRQSTSYQKR